MKGPNHKKCKKYNHQDCLLKEKNLNMWQLISDSNMNNYILPFLHIFPSSNNRFFAKDENEKIKTKKMFSSFSSRDPIGIKRYDFNLWQRNL